MGRQKRAPTNNAVPLRSPEDRFVGDDRGGRGSQCGWVQCGREVPVAASGPVVGRGHGKETTTNAPATSKIHHETPFPRYFPHVENL